MIANSIQCAIGSSSMAFLTMSISDLAISLLTLRLLSGKEEYEGLWSAWHILEVSVGEHMEGECCPYLSKLQIHRQCH